MKDDIRQYARLGLVHHMLYPRCMEDADDHVETLAAFVRRTDIETFDCCLPYGRQRRAKLIPLIRNCGKSDIAFAIHLYPLRKLFLSSTTPHEQAQVRMIMEDMVEQAAAIGATGFVFGSGGPSPAQATEQTYAAFRDLCRWLCGRLAPHGITALLEPFDTDVDKKFLYGSTADCVKLIESLRPAVNNFGIELDIAHLPLMGEDFASAIRTVAPYLKRVHLGNCVLKDKDHPLYGDFHPPIGFEGGEVDVPQIIEILGALLEVGFLSKHKRGALLIEMTPWPGKTVEQTVQDGFDRLQRAWAAI